MAKYLDSTGLTRYDGKIKDFVKAMANGSSFAVINSYNYNVDGNTLSGWSYEEQEDGIYLKYNNSTNISKANVEAYVQLMFGEKRLPVSASASARGLYVMPRYDSAPLMDGYVYRLRITPNGNNYVMMLELVLALATNARLASASVTVKYQHNIRLYYASFGICISFSLITNSSTPLTYNKVTKALYDSGFTSGSNVCPANGFKIDGSAMRGIYGVYSASSSATGTSLYYRYVTLNSLSSSTATIAGSLSDNTNSTTLSSSWTIQDTVVPVVGSVV